MIKAFPIPAVVSPAKDASGSGEIAVYRYPERFSEKTNAYLHCENCTEKLCTHKKQLQTLWVKVREQEKKAEARIRSWKR